MASKVSVLAALDAALKAAKPADVDAATVALARRYAAELDEAAVLSVRMTKALRKLNRYVEAGEVSQELFEDFEGLASRIEETHVAGLIGPKLLAALEQLQLTPAARKAVVPPGGGGGDGTGSASALGQLRALGGNRAKAVDPSAS